MRILLSLLIITLCYYQSQSQTSLRFDGIDDCVYVPSYNALDMKGNFTLEAKIFKPDWSQSASLSIAQQYDKEKQQGWHFYLSSSSLTLTLGLHTYTVPCEAKENMHVAVVREGEVLRFYANGTLLAQRALDGSIVKSCVNCDLLLGNQQDLSTPFNGYMQELKLWNIARSLEELQAAESTLSTELVGFWNFAAGAGQFVNNHVDPLHYGRLGQTFYEDAQDPTWEVIPFSGLGYEVPDFVIHNKNPKEGDAFVLTNKTSELGRPFYWLINSKKYTSAQLSTATFASGMNVIQLVQESAVGNMVATKMVNTSTNMVKSGTASSGPYVIPVVFHIIGTQAQLDAFNLASGRVEAQLLELNTQFSNNNTNIRFCLAKRLPIDLVNAGRTWASFGTASTPGRPGVTYTLDDATTNLNISTFDLGEQDLVNNRLPAVLPFAPEEYMSVYVTPNVVLPSGTSVQGVANVGPSGEPVDGLGVTHNAFTNASTGMLGRVLVHEAGHWLSLHHVFRPTGDFVDDTYEQSAPTNAPPQNPGVQPVTNCTTPYTTGIPTVPYVPYFRGQNHMDYHLEQCKEVFTAGQGSRMRLCLANDRPFIHTTLNLINTGVQAPASTSCVVGNNYTADFTLSSGELCEGYAFTAKGFNPPAGLTATFSWNVSWSTNNTGTAPSFTVNHSNQTGRVNAMTITSAGGTAAGLWTVQLTMVANGTTTLVSTKEIRLLDCSAGPQRYRKTTNLDTTDWHLDGLSIATGVTKNAQNQLLDGYVVVGSDLKATPTTGVLLFVDTLGKILWRKTIASSTGNVRLYDVVSPITFQGNANCYAMTGYTEVNSKKQTLVIITNELGTVLYQEAFPISDNGTLHQYAMGKQIVQLSSAFNRQLAVVGFAGAGLGQVDDKAGFVLGIDPSSTLGSTLKWSKFYETTKSSYNTDYDFVENIVETTATIGGQQKQVLIVTGNSNRGSRSTSSTFLSCLSIASANTVTEEWRTNYEALNNIGAYYALGAVENNGRVFMMGYGDISHGTYVREVNTSDGTLGEALNIRNFIADEILIDQGSCILFGKHYTNDDFNAFKMALPATLTSNWGPSSTATTRRYDKTLNTNIPYFVGWGLQNFVKSPNGGYMGITVVEVNQGPNVSKLEMSVIKVDEFLINACANTTDFEIGSLISPFKSLSITETPTETIAHNTTAVTTSNGGAVCMEDGCIDAYYFQKNAQNCNQTLKLLVSDVVPTGANYSYQWSPVIDLDDPTIMEPTTSTTVNQTYTLIVTNTVTGCQVAEVVYHVTTPTTVTYNHQQTVCNTGATNSYPLDLIANLQSGYTSYSWFPNAFLDNPNVLQPNCSAITNQTYQLVAQPIHGGNTCNTVIVNYELLVNNQVVQEVNGFCIDSTYPGYFQDPNQTQLVWKNRIDLDILYTHFYTAPLPANGYWIVETYNNNGSAQVLFNVYNSLPRFDNSNNSIALAIVTELSHIEYLTYIYPDSTSSCGDRKIRIRLGPANTIQSSANIEICPGETVTFQGTPSTLNSSFNPRTLWYINTFNGCNNHPNYPFYLSSNPPQNTLTHTFPNSSSCNYYTVGRQLKYDCPHPNGGTFMRVTSSNHITVRVLTDTPSITLMGCLGRLHVNYNNVPNPVFRWFEVGNTTALATGNYFLPPHPGNYFAEVTSSQGCDFVTAPFSYQGILKSTITATSLACATSRATATVTPVGGQAPYTYLWSNGQATATATGLTAGMHRVTVTDANGCKTKDSIQVVAGSPLQTQLTATQINCYVANSASITQVVSNGTAPYTYLWSNGATTPNLTGTQISTAGTYCVTVTDANGCTVSSCATIKPLVDVDFSKTSSVNQAQAGDQITYKIFMKNNCQYPVSFDLKDVLPTGVALTHSGGFTYNASANTLTKQITLPGGAAQTYDYKVVIVADGVCDNKLSLKNEITAKSLDDPKIVLTRSAVVDVTEHKSNCDISKMNISFEQAIEAGVLLPMTGTNSAINTPQTVVINGTWRLSPGQVYLFAPGSKIIMEAGAEIIISKGAKLTIVGTAVKGCSCLWHRILVESNGELAVEEESHLQDAQYAIETEDGSSLTIRHSHFENNFIGWYTAPKNTRLSQYVKLNAFYYNHFSAKKLKPAFSGAPLTPVLDDDGQRRMIALPTSNGAGLSGVHLWNMKEVKIETAKPSASNRFEHLVTGITAFDSKLFVNSGSFQAIRKNTSLYPNNLGLQGAAIHCQGSEGHLAALTVLGTKLVNKNIVNFSYCDIGVSGISTQMTVEHCVMKKIHEVGIKAVTCNNTWISIKGNVLMAMGLEGISCVNNQGKTQHVIAYSKIELDHATNNFAQLRAGIRADKCSSVSAVHNNVESYNSQFGIVCNNVGKSEIIDNNVHLLGSYNNNVRTGIAVSGGESFVSCNKVNGNSNVRSASNTRALSGRNLKRSLWQCNQLSETYTGAYFEGFNALSLKGTVFHKHHVGLLLSNNAIIGKQYQHGNVWMPGTMVIGAMNQNSGNVAASFFAIHPAYSVPNTLPQTIIPSQGWFGHTSGADNTFNCNNTGKGSPVCSKTIAAFPGHKHAIIKSKATIAKGERTFKDMKDKKAWELRLYPNPAVQHLTLQSNRELSATCQVEVYNALGQLMSIRIDEQTTQQVVLDVSKLTPGFYTVRLLDKGEQFNHTFVVSKP